MHRSKKRARRLEATQLRQRISVKRTEVEDLLAFQMKACNVRFAREFKPWADRRFRFDFRVADQRILIEVQGAVWVKGGHSTGRGITRDAEKLSLAAADGWRVIVATTDQVKSGVAIQWIVTACAWQS